MIQFNDSKSDPPQIELHEIEDCLIRGEIVMQNSRRVSFTKRFVLAIEKSSGNKKSVSVEIENERTDKTTEKKFQS